MIDYIIIEFKNLIYFSLIHKIIIKSEVIRKKKLMWFNFPWGKELNYDTYDI